MSSEECLIPRNDAERQRFERMVKGGSLVRPAPGIYARAAWWLNTDPITRQVCLAKALAQKHPEWVFCHTTAAAVWGFSLPYGRLTKVHVVASTNNHRRNNSVISFHRLANLRCIEYHGVRVTTRERTATDCMRTLPPASGLAVADSATRSNAWDDLYLARYLEDNPLPKLHGLARAKLVALLADARAESGGESIARANIIRAGFALPELQFEVRGNLDGNLYRVDFAWKSSQHPVANMTADRSPDTPTGTPPRMIFGELDGKIKYQDPQMAPNGALDALLAERRRESELTLASDGILRLSYDEASSVALLTKKLETFGVPRTRDPLVLTKDARHNRREVIEYLRLNERTSASAAKRIEFVEGHH